MVRSEDDQSIVGRLLPIQLIQHLADPCIDLFHHGIVYGGPFLHLGSVSVSQVSRYCLTPCQLIVAKVDMLVGRHKYVIFVLKIVRCIGFCDQERWICSLRCILNR